MFNAKLLTVYLGDISLMARVIILPHVTLSVIFTFILHELFPALVVFELSKIFDFTLTSFPLTIAAVIIAYNMARDKDNLLVSCGIILLSGIAGGLLHSWVIKVPDFPSFPDADMVRLHKYGSFYYPVLAFKLLVYYTKKFGWLMFIQAIIVGAIAGNRLADWKVKRMENDV